MALLPTREPEEVFASDPPIKSWISRLLREMIDALNGKAEVTRSVLPYNAETTGTGSAYTVTSDELPIGGQIIHFSPHANSAGAPTLTITNGTASVTSTLRSASGSTVRLLAGTTYIVRWGNAFSRVLSQDASGVVSRSAAVGVDAPTSVAKAASAVAGPAVYGSRQPMLVSGPVAFQLQPLHPRSLVQMIGPAGILDCRDMTLGTVVEVCMRTGDRIVAGAGRNFLGRAGGGLTATGDCIVRVIAMYSVIAIEEVAGATPTYGAAPSISYNASIVWGGQSNALQAHIHGGIGGFSWAMRNWINTPLERSIRWINGATGGTSIDRRSVAVGATNYWWDATAASPGPALDTFMAAVSAAVTDGAPAPTCCFWTQGEGDAGPLQNGALTVAEMTATIKAVWAYIRQTYPSMTFIVNMIGSHDARNVDVGANGARVAYLKAVATTAYAAHGAELYDLQRAEGDIHHHGSAYAIMGARLARIYANEKHGQSNALGPQVTGFVYADGGKTVTLTVDWGGADFVPEVADVYSDRPFGIYALAPGASAATANIPFLSGRITDGSIVLTSSVPLTGCQIGGPWGYAPDARRGHIIRDYETDPYHLSPGQPLRTFLIQI